MAEIPVLAAAPAAAPADGGKRKKLIIIAAAALVVLGGGGAGAWFFLKGGDPASAEAEHKEDSAPKAPPQYVALDPPFVVNFQGQSNVRFLQISVQLMTRDLHTVEELKSNDPAIRNDLLLLFGNQKHESIATLEGKEALRNQALETVRKIVKANGGEPNLIEAVYFTSFVMQ
jgi:flagellar protein FliL